MDGINKKKRQGNTALSLFTDKIIQSKIEIYSLRMLLYKKSMGKVALNIFLFLLLVLLIVCMAILAPHYFAGLSYSKLLLGFVFYGFMLLISFLYTCHRSAKEHLTNARFWLKSLSVTFALFVFSQFILNLIEPFMFEATL